MTRLYNIYVGRTASFFFIILFLGDTRSAIAIQQYTIQNLGDITPFAINDSSQITGFAPGGSPQAEVWSIGTLTQLQPPGLSESFGVAINDTGEVVGWGINGQNAERGFAWDSATGFLNVSIPAGESAFYTVNNAGEIGGNVSSNGGIGPAIATIWSAQGNFTLLASLPGADDSTVRSLNNAGQAVGSSGLSGFDNWPGNPAAQYADNHAALWQNGQVIDLTPGNPWSNANAINNQGQVAGYRMIVVGDDMVSVPFIWDSTHGLVDLPYYGLESSAEDINEEGQVVGSTANPNDPSSLVAALWQNGMLYNLNDLLPADSGWILNEATDINDSGQIVGDGTYDGQQEGFLLTPTSITSIPEPAAIPLATAFCLLSTRRRRRLGPLNLA